MILDLGQIFYDSIVTIYIDRCAKTDYYAIFCIGR